MRTNCFELFPAGECSVYGTCVVVDSPDNSTFQERCVCDRGWSQSKEMSLYFLDGEDIDVNQVGLCTQNKSALITVYILALVATIMAFVHQSSRITKKKQLIRLFPLLLGFVLIIFLCAYKLSDFDGVNLGQDPLFTALFRNTELLNIAAVTISFQRYIFYILKRTQLGNLKLTKKVRVFSTASNYVLLSDFIIYQVLWTTIFLARGVGYNVLRVFLFLTLFRNQYTLFMVHILYGTITRDLRSFLSLAESSQKQYASEKRVNFAHRNLAVLRYQVPILFIVWSIVCILAADSRGNSNFFSTASSLFVKSSFEFRNGFKSTTQNRLTSLNVRMQADKVELVARLTESLPTRGEKENLCKMNKKRGISI
eukprot:snap_masked-scaffold_38-processed-gene-0.24-mRNA-1 protein AED:1.00 eAED:1.00 QI:0/0/0/0/1/1/2/0/367